MQPLLQWKSAKYYILCVSVFVFVSLCTHAMHMLCNAFSLWLVLLYNIFPYYLINSMILGIKIEQKMCVLVLSTTRVSNIFSF